MVTVNGRKGVNYVSIMTSAGMILAGGKSLRMGQDKALLPYQGLSLLEHMQEILKPVTLSNIYISHSDYIADCIADKGPLGGIYSVVQGLPKQVSFLLIIPVDMPLLQPELLQVLVNKAILNKPVACHYQDALFPLLLPINSVVKERLKQAVSSYQKTYSVRWLLEKITVDILPLNQEDLSAFINTNTPEQWALLMKEKK